MSTRLVDVQRYHWLRKLLRKQSGRPKLPDSSAARGCAQYFYEKGLGTRCLVESQVAQAHFLIFLMAYHFINHHICSLRSWRNCFCTCESLAELFFRAWEVWRWAREGRGTRFFFWSCAKIVKNCHENIYSIEFNFWTQSLSE